jgi:TetR/AcrR family transcriptional regulator
MARTRAADYDEKRLGILKQAARLFADHGYDRATLGMIGQACGMSKSLLYYYYSDKAVLLYDIINNHLSELERRTADAEQGAADPRERLTALAIAVLEAYREADAEHAVQLAALRFLPAERQSELRDLQRLIVKRFAAAIAAALPGLPSDQLTPVTMSLFGMLNWHYMWFTEKGPMSRADYARLAVRLILGEAGHPTMASPCEPIGESSEAIAGRSRSRRSRSLAELDR